MAMFVVAAEEQGVPARALTGRSRTTSSRSSWSQHLHLPPGPSMRIVADIIAWCAARRRAGTRSRSPATTSRRRGDGGPGARLHLADGWSTCAPRSPPPRGRPLRPAPLLLLRRRDEPLHGGREAARRTAALAELMRERFAPADRAPHAAHALPDSGWSLTALDPYNNVVRTTSRPSRPSSGDAVPAHELLRRGARAALGDLARIARNTQLILREETGSRASSTPSGLLLRRGAHRRPRARARLLIGEVENLGGMTRAVETACPSAGSRRPRRAGRRGSTAARRRSSG